MRNDVQRFPIRLRDPYADARASMAGGGRRGPMALWLSTLAALLLGAAVGWQLLQRSSWQAAATAPLAIASSMGRLPAIAMPEPAARLIKDEAANDGAWPDYFATIEPGDADNGAALRQSPAAADRRAWPIILHRAADGRFYADLLIDAAIVNVHVDPRAPRTRLGRRDLPLDLPVDADGLLTGRVLLEHHRVPARSLPVDGDPRATSIIGADLLERHFAVEESRERLRLAPLSRSAR